ncbi:hypothetical protein T439DRAFT_323762 [Meredithblackwellia eburnea MCA 4105]
MSAVTLQHPSTDEPVPHAANGRAHSVVTLPPISSLIESLQQDRPPPTSNLPQAREAFARPQWDSLESSSRSPVERPTQLFQSPSAAPQSYPPSDLRRFHSPTKPSNQSYVRSSGDFADNQNVFEETRRRPVTAGALSSPASKRFDLGGAKPEEDQSFLPPSNSTSRHALSPAQPPPLFRRRSNSLSLPPNTGGFLHSQTPIIPPHVMDDDRTPTVEHPHFPLLPHMPPGATVGEALATTEQRFHPHPQSHYYTNLPQKAGWFDPYSQRQAIQGYYHPAPGTVAPRKRSEPMYFVESSSPRGNKAQYGRTRAASFSSADEYRSIPAWAGEGDGHSIGGRLSSAGSSPRPIGSPVDTATESSASSVRSSFSVESSASSTSPPAHESSVLPQGPVPAMHHPQGTWVVSPRAVPVPVPASAVPVSYIGRHGSIGGTPDLASLDINGPGPTSNGWAHVPHYAYHQAHQGPRVLVHPGTHIPPSAWGPRLVMDPALRPPGSMGMGMEMDEDPNADAGRYACPHCSKRFARPSSLRIHIHSHTGEKPFDCHLCGRGFSVQSNLRRHLKIHANAGKKGGKTGVRKEARSESGKSRSSVDGDGDESAASASESEDGHHHHGRDHLMDEDKPNAEIDEDNLKDEIDELEA